MSIFSTDPRAERRALLQLKPKQPPPLGAQWRRLPVPDDWHTLAYRAQAFFRADDNVAVISEIRVAEGVPEYSLTIGQTDGGKPILPSEEVAKDVLAQFGMSMARAPTVAVLGKVREFFWRDTGPQG